MWDVVIIGAGVTGCAIARELSQYELSIAVLERELDVGEGTSKANSGIVHAGFDAKPGTLKAKLNVLGNQQMEKLSKELDFEFTRNGSIVVCFKKEDIKKLEALKKQGEQNGVPNLKVLNQKEVHALEPNLSDDVVAALFAPTGGIVCPFGLTISLAENAQENGVVFSLGTKVTKAEQRKEGFELLTNKGTFVAKTVINAAGVYADVLHRMVSKEPLTIVERRGEYCLMDKVVGNLVSHTVFQLPSELGKGVLVTPTVHGNLLIGPTAETIEDKESLGTTKAGLDQVLKKASQSIKALPTKKIITSFAGLRAHEASNDFIIREATDAKGWFDVAGIESPGLSCAPAIGSYVAGLYLKRNPTVKKEHVVLTRTGLFSMAKATLEEKAEMIAKDERYSNVICRCEMVTEGEIVAAIHRPLGATTLDGIKRRTRAGMGRCQAGFCSPKTVEILARELNVPEEEILKSQEKSNILLRKEKADEH